ncbi:MAG: hypothetical protein IJ196_02115 [Prevotella sp.]|nr:hypothetical protein [Prevotella sp.]
MKKSALLLLVLLAMACTSETYDTGNGDLSLMRADFVEAHSAVEGKAFDSATTDEDVRLAFSQPLEAGWITTADSTYRALLYYNKEAERIRPVSISRVMVLRPAAPGEDEGEAKTDPVGLESAWMSWNGRYINLGLLLKSGRTDDEEAAQRIGVRRSSQDETSLSLTFIHDQGGVPEYYTSRVYASIPVTEDMKGKAVSIQINTWQGIVERTFQVGE